MQNNMEQDSFDLINDPMSGAEQSTAIMKRVQNQILKDKLLEHERKCRLCGVMDKRFLNAIHIKPWRVANEAERLDPENAFLFCPNHEVLFEKGFISFSSTGKVLVSPFLAETSRLFMNVQDNFYIKMTAAQVDYIKYHRDKVFKKIG